MPRMRSDLRLVDTARPRAPRDDRPCLLHVVGSRCEAARAAAVARAVATGGALRQVVVVGGPDDGGLPVGDATAIGLPAADHVLPPAEGSRAQQVAGLLTTVESVLLDERPLVAMIGGESNAALACGLVAAKLGIAVVHADAGLRSWEWSSAEEVNRVLCDRLADTLLAGSAQARENLLHEGVPHGRIHQVGDALADTLLTLEPALRDRAAWTEHGLSAGGYVLVSVHAAGNVTDGDRLGAILDAVTALRGNVPTLFVVHPRANDTLAVLGGRGALAAAGVMVSEAVDHADFLSLLAGAGAVVTDSGAVQDEAAALGVCCFTLGATTARPVTLTHGRNLLLGDDPQAIAEVRLPRTSSQRISIPLWEGQAARRIAAVLVANYTLATSILGG